VDRGLFEQLAGIADRYAGGTDTVEGTFTYEVWGRSAGVTIDMAQVLAILVVTALPQPQATPMTAIYVSSDVASPRPAQQSVRFTAGAQGGSPPVQYKWFVNGSVAQNWSAATTYIWTPVTAGSYSIGVWARNAGVTADVADATTSFSFTVTAPSSPQMTGIRWGASNETRSAAGTTISIAWSGEGGTPPYEFRVELQAGNGALQLLRDWSSATSADKTVTTADTYRFRVSGRSAGSATGAAEYTGNFSFLIQDPVVADPPSSVTLTANRTSPQPLGSAIGLTATARGSGSGTVYEYKYQFQLGSGAPLVLPGWGSPGTYTWAPSAAGTYTITVFARQARAGESAPQVSTTLVFVVSPWM
jgi:hypothetical protein